MSNYENLILNQQLYLKSYIFNTKGKIFNLNIENKSYNFKLLKTFKYTFLKKEELKKNKNLKKKLILLNLNSNINFFLIKQKQINNYIKLISLFKNANNYNFESLYIYFVKKIIFFNNSKNTNKELIKNSILQYKSLNIIRYIYNFKKKNFLNLNIYYIKQKEKKKTNNLNIYLVKKEQLLNNNLNLFFYLNSLIEQKLYSKLLNILDNKLLLNDLKKQHILKFKNVFLNIKYIYYLCYIYSFYINKKN